MTGSIYPGEKAPLLFGHRGYSSIAPENTLPAFQEILNRKVPGVELDIHLCKSGELVVTHDHNLKRITGMDATIEELEYSEIRKLDAGDWKDKKFRGERIPLLQEVFDLLGSSVYYDIEIKTMETGKTGLDDKLFKLIRENRLEERIIVSSFNPMPVKYFKKLAPHIPTAIIYSDDKDVPWYLRSGGGRWIASTDILKPVYKKIKNRTGRQPVVTWTVDSPAEAERLLRAGVSGIISNKPAEIGITPGRK